MCFVIYLGVSWFLNRDLIEAKSDQANLNNSVTAFLNNLSKDNQYSMSGTMKRAQEHAAKAAVKAQEAQSAYVNAMERDPPWYLEFTDGVLWWDKKRVTKNEAADARFELERAQYRYEQIRATDEIFNKDKAGNLTIWDRIKAWFNDLLCMLGLNQYDIETGEYSYTNQVQGTQDTIESKKSGGGFVKFTLVLILIIILLLLLYKSFSKQIKMIAKHNKRKAKKKYKDVIDEHESKEKNNELHDEKRKEIFVMKGRSAFDDSVDMDYWLKSECDKAGVDMEQVLKMYGGRSDKAFIAMYNARMDREQSQCK